MRGPKPNNPIQLVDKEIAQLQKLISAHKTPQAKVRRATVILLAHQHPEWSNQELGRAAGLTPRSVRAWRQRWCETKCLDDLPRPGAPRRFSP